MAVSRAGQVCAGPGRDGLRQSAHGRGGVGCRARGIDQQPGVRPRDALRAAGPDARAVAVGVRLVVEWVGLERQLARTAALRRSLARDRFDRNEPAPAPSTPYAGDPAAKLEETKKKTEKMIKLARDSGRPYAADNLEHWYRGSGTPVVMPAAAFTGEKFLLDHLKDVHGKRLSLGAENRVKDGRLKAGQSVTMTWTDSVNAPIDRELFYALGGFTVESTMDVTATTIPEDPSGMLLITVTRWGVKCSDEYNFDPARPPTFGGRPGHGRRDGHAESRRAGEELPRGQRAVRRSGAARREDRVRHRGAEAAGAGAPP